MLALSTFTVLNVNWPAQPVKANPSGCGTDWLPLINMWPNWRNDASNTAAYPLLGPAINETLWTTAMNGSSFAPVANWGKVFLVHYPAYVTAYDAATGIKIWEVDESGQPQPPSYRNGERRHQHSLNRKLRRLCDRVQGG
jgi:hypothetical protein